MDYLQLIKDYGISLEVNADTKYTSACVMKGLINNELGSRVKHIKRFMVVDATLELAVTHAIEVYNKAK